MTKRSFSFNDLSKKCEVHEGCFQLNSSAGLKKLGARVIVPEVLFETFPFNSSAYSFLQELRGEIFEYGLIEFPNLPVNKINHTVAMRSPKEHSYSSNPYLTEPCQSPHQDTPPYPTAFWLNEVRRYFATWIMTDIAVEDFYQFSRANSNMNIEEIHRQLVPQSLQQQTGLLLNHQPGLLLIDNSARHSLYHAKTCKFDAVLANPGYDSDTPMYTFNEVGLLNYMDELDSRRGQGFRDSDEVERVREFMQREKLHQLES